MLDIIRLSGDGIIRITKELVKTRLKIKKERQAILISGEDKSKDLFYTFTLGYAWQNSPDFLTWSLKPGQEQILSEIAEAYNLSDKKASLQKDLILTIENPSILGVVCKFVSDFETIQYSPIKEIIGFFSIPKPIQVIQIFIFEDTKEP